MTIVHLNLPICSWFRFQAEMEETAPSKRIIAIEGGLSSLREEFSTLQKENSYLKEQLGTVLEENATFREIIFTLESDNTVFWELLYDIQGELASLKWIFPIPHPLEHQVLTYPFIH